MKQYDQATVISFLKSHKLTSEWFRTGERRHMMDCQMMLVDAILNLPEDEKHELISNIDKIELFSRIIKPDMNDMAREVIKYLIGLPSKYQPPTKWRFAGDENEAIINTVIN